MARYIGPKSKIARRFRDPIFGPDKALDKRAYGPGQHRMFQHIDDFNLECNDINLNLSGASIVRLTVNGAIDLDASGSSILEYKGHPTIRHLNLSGSARLIDSN